MELVRGIWMVESGSTERYVEEYTESFASCTEGEFCSCTEEGNGQRVLQSCTEGNVRRCVQPQK